MYFFSSKSTDSALFTTDHFAATKNQYFFLKRSMRCTVK